MSRKVKYDLAFKLRCVKEILEKHQSITLVSEFEGFHHTMLRKWIADYTKHGILGLKSNTNQRYSAEFKLNVITSITKHNLSLREASLKFNIPSKSVVIKWQKDFSNFGVDGLQPKLKDHPKIMKTSKSKSTKPKQPLTREEELLLENERLRCENELLKKFNALIQAEEEKQNKLGQKP